MASGLGHGVVPVLCAAFADDGALEPTSVERQAALLAQFPFGGMAVGLGTELPRLTEAERTEVVRSIRRGAEQTFLIVGIDAASVESALLHAEAVAESGASMLMVRPLSSDFSGLSRQFNAMGEIGIPVMLQDAPAFNSAPVSAEVLCRLVEGVPAIQALKIEGPDSVNRIRSVRRLCPDITIFGGGGGNEFLYELAAGSDGTMPGPSVAAALLSVWRAYHPSDTRPAWELFASLVPLLALQARSFDVFLTLQKSLLQDWGIFASDRIRAPFLANGDLRRDRDQAVSLLRIDLKTGQELTL